MIFKAAVVAFVLFASLLAAVQADPIPIYDCNVQFQSNTEYPANPHLFNYCHDHEILLGQRHWASEEGAVRGWQVFKPSVFGIIFSSGLLFVYCIVISLILADQRDHLWHGAQDVLQQHCLSLRVRCFSYCSTLLIELAGGQSPPIQAAA